MMGCCDCDPAVRTRGVRLGGACMYQSYARFANARLGIFKKPRQPSPAGGKCDHLAAVTAAAVAAGAVAAAVAVVVL